MNISRVKSRLKSQIKHIIGEFTPIIVMFTIQFLVMIGAFYCIFTGNVHGGNVHCLLSWICTLTILILLSTRWGRTKFKTYFKQNAKA